MIIDKGKQELGKQPECKFASHVHCSFAYLWCI